MSAQDLVRSLVAAGSVRSPDDEDEGIYLLHVSDGNLVEKLWVDDGVKNETMIASDAKEDTSASYLLNVKQGLVSPSSSSRGASCNRTDTMPEWPITASRPLHRPVQCRPVLCLQ